MFEDTWCVADCAYNVRSIVTGLGGIVTTIRILWGKNPRLLLAMVGTHVASRIVEELLGKAQTRVRKAAAKKVPIDIKAEFAAIESRSFFAMMRCCGREEANAKRLEVQMAADGRDSRRMRALRSMFEQASMILDDSSTYLSFLIGGSSVIANELSAGSLAAFIAQSQQLLRDLEHLYEEFQTMVADNMESVRKVARFYALRPEIGLTGGQYTKPTAAEEAAHEWSVEFKDCTFAYPSDVQTKILDGFSLKVDAGDVVGICGKTHCGKSTLLRLLERLYDVQEGEIIIGGKSIKSIDPSWLRRRVGFVMSVKDTCVLGGRSILENIELGALLDELDPAEARSRVEAAATLSDLINDIEEFPKGWHTTIGDHGDVNLSDGQTQRLSIARGVIGRPVEINGLGFTENLLENPEEGGFGAPHQCSLGTAACYHPVMLTAALLMTSLHSSGQTCY